MSDQHEIRGLENIIGNHVDNPDERADHLHARLRASAQTIRNDPTWNGPVLITSPAIKARYAATLERLARERNEAAYEWNRLRWWQWRKRKRLWRKLFGIGGWRIAPSGLWEELPERVTRCGRFIKHYQEGGC